MEIMYLSTENQEERARAERYEKKAFIKKAFIGGFCLSLSLFAGGCSYKKYFLPDTPLIYSGCQNATAPHMQLQREPSLDENPSYKNTTVEQRTKERTPADGLEATIAAVKEESCTSRRSSEASAGAIAR